MSAISNLKSALGAGLRTTKYLVQIIPTNTAITSFNDTAEVQVDGKITQTATTDATQLDLLCKGTSFPQKTVGQTEVWVGGKKGMLVGDTEFDHTWDLVFYETEDHKLREAFIAWQDSIDDVEGYNKNDRSVGGTATISQLDGQGNPTMTYTFHNIWPQVISTLDMANDSVNAIGEFTVTLSFDYWKLKKDTVTTTTTTNG